MQQGAIVQQQQQLGQQPQAAQVSLWDSIDAEVEPLTNEQRQLLLSNEEYVNNYNALQNMVQVEVLNLVRAKIENSEEGRNLLTTQLKLVKSLKTGIVTEEIEIINSIDNYDFTIPLIGDGNISRGNVTLSIPFINKGIVFNQSDLETFRQLLIQE